MSPLFSCKGCTERHVNCHSSCEKYKAEKARYESLKEKERKERLLDEYEVNRALKVRAAWARRNKRFQKVEKDL